MSKRRAHIAFGFALIGVGLLSATVVPTEDLEANKPQLGNTHDAVNNTFTLDWATQPDVYYFVEGSNNLETWIPAKLLTDHTGTGSLSLGTNINPPKAFFRLSLEGDPDSARLRADDDGDKIINLLEANAGEDAFETATSGDDDTDGIPDYWELFHFNTLDHDGSYVDIEGGLSLTEAYAAATNPNSVDSDGDGYSDAYETLYGMDANYNESRDDPDLLPNADKDKDGLTNQEETVFGTKVDNPNTDDDSAALKDGEDGWALDQNLNPPRVSENYVVIDLSGHLPFPSGSYQDLRIQVDDSGGTMLAYKTDAVTPSTSVKKFVTLYYDFDEVLEPPALNGDITISHEDGVGGDEINGYIKYAFNMTPVLNRQGKLSFQGHLDYESIKTPLSAFTNLVSALDVGYDTTEKPLGTSTPVIPAAHLVYVTTNVDSEYAYYDLKLHHSKYTDDFAGSMIGFDPSSIYYYSYFQGQDMLSESNQEDASLVVGNTALNQMHWALKGFGAHESSVYSVKSDEFATNEIEAVKVRLLDGTLKDVDDEYSYSIISDMDTDIILRKKNGSEFAYSLDNGTTFLSSEVWFPKENEKEAISFEGESSEDLTILQSNRVLLNGRAISFADLIGDQSEQWSSIQLTDINSHGMMVGHALTNPTDGSTPDKRVIALLKVDVEWETVDGMTAGEDLEDNLENYISDQYDWLNGLRYFPGAATPDEEAYKTKVNVRVSVPGYKNGKVKLRAFDVDDPTEIADVDDDSGDSLGDDNLDTVDLPLGGEVTLGIFSGEVPLGTKVEQDLSEGSITINLDDDGEALVEFILGIQPGNNYRIAAELLIDGQTSEIGNLQVDAAGDDYVTGDNEAVSALKMGALTDMLTIWRKLHIEVDSMEAGPPLFGDERNTVEGTITDYTLNQSPIFIEDPIEGDRWAAGNASIELSSNLPGDENRFERGQIGITDIGTFHVISSSDDSLVIRIDTSDALPTTSPIGKSFVLVDDDDLFLSEAGLGFPLPQHSNSEQILSAIKPKFEPAYIETVDAASLELNEENSISFNLNEPSIGYGGFSSHFDEAQDLTDTSYFWAHTLVFGYQPAEGHDNDPNGEALHLGETPEQQELWKGGLNFYNGTSVVYVESIRESILGNELSSGILGNPDAMAGYRELYLNLLYGTVAHEIAHAPGQKPDSSDHSELQLMRDTPAPIGLDFSALTIKRFRSSESWGGELYED